MHKNTVDPQEIAKFAKLAQHWWDKQGELRTLHDINPLRLDFVVSQTDLQNKRVLDVGCGGGIFSEALASQQAIVVGIDAEENAIEIARQHAVQQQLSIDYACTPIEDYSAELFDVVTCMEMLEHVADPDVIIQQCSRLLKPGGYLFLSTINRTLKAYLGAIVAAEYVMNLLPKQTHDYKKFIQPSELAAMVRCAGLDVIDLQGMSYNPFTHRASLQKSVDINYLMACRKPLAES